MYYIELFKEAAKKYSARAALADCNGTRTLTYSELDLLSDRICAKIKSMSLAWGSAVMICMGRKSEYIAAYLGVLKAGCAVVPVIPEYPKSRLDFIKSDCECKLCITDEFFSDIENYGPAPFEKPGGEVSALLLYTSGSTGNPKGIRHTFRSFNSGAVRKLEHYDMKGELVFAASAPLSFIAVLGEYHKVFLKGGCVHILSDEVRRDVKKLEDYYLKHKITMGFISPQMLRLFDCKSEYLERVLTGSERLSGVYSDRYEIINIYAMSETAAIATYFTVDKKYSNTPVGVPAEGIELLLLDDGGNPVSEGQEGEICLKGQFAVEYLNLPEESKKTFTDCGNGVILLHTRDMGRLQPDGNLVYVNRRDWMVKINGQRVETGEIEAAISSVEGVRGAAVKAFEDSNGQNYLTAFYACENEISDKIWEKLKSELPDYMIPRFFKRLSEMPKNINGKLDRKALLPPDASEFKKEYIAPKSETEELLCIAMEKALNCGRVGACDDFLALGGDSISAVRLACIAEKTGITPEQVFSGKTPEKMAELCSAASACDEDWVLDKNRKAYPLTPSETGMYIEQKLNPSSVEYNINSSLVITGADDKKIKSALTSVMLSHEAFRSRYEEQEGAPVRILTESTVEISERTVNSREEALALSASENKPFSLSEIPVRATLYTVGDGSFVLGLCMHHIMIDGNGLNIIVRELCARLAGKEPEVSEYDLSYSCTHADKRAGESALQYFKSVFADGVPVNEMPVKGSRPKVHPVSDTLNEYDLGAEKTKKLKLAAKYYSVTVFEMLFAAISMTAAKYCVSEDVVLGIPKDTRSPKLSNTVGMFINTLPVRVKPKRSMSVREYLGEVSSQVRGASANSACPFETLVNEFVSERNPSRHPIFDIGINLLKTDFTQTENGVTVTAKAQPQKMGRDFNLFFEESEASLKLTLQYSSRLFDCAVALNFAEQIASVLDNLISCEEMTLREAMRLPENQKAALDKLNDNKDENHGIQLLHRRFEDTADKIPQNTAVIACDATLTYALLEDKANRVANSLIEKGFAPGNSAVVMLRRTSAFFAVCLGVLKAGGAYIPVDPNYPPERIKSIIDDSGSRFIITDGAASDFPDSLTASVLMECVNSQRPDADIQPGDLAYMIYTSGSTGKPKGVMIEHRSICNYVRSHPKNLFGYELAKEGVTAFLSVTTVSFDMSMKELYIPLLNGIPVVFADEKAAADPKALIELFNKTNAQGFNATPSRLEQYLTVKGFDKVVKSLKVIGCGGEKYPKSLLEKLRKLTSAVLINTYGPTEITVSSNMAVLKDEITVGEPVLNVSEYIVDKFGDELPFGVTGELYIGGMGVARGYKNLEKATAEHFINYRGERIYKSGDYARRDADGKISILGRTDSQVKLRGLRIELGEIESVISSFEGINEVAVLIKSIGGTEYIAAYYTAGKEISVPKLKAYAKSKLTHYMVPDAYMQLDSMPYTPNGKKDVKNLPEPVLFNESPSMSAPARLTRLEKELCALAQKAIGCPVNDIDSSLINLGLTSLTAISFTSFIEDRFGCEVPVSFVMQGASITDTEDILIEELLKGNKKQSAPQGKAAEASEALSEYPLTSIQMGVYYDVMKHPGEILYNMPQCCVFDSVNAEKLRDALIKTIGCHPYMNTVIRQKNGKPVQIMQENFRPEIEILRMTEDEFDKYKFDFVRPFNLCTDTLYRFVIVKTEEKTYLLSDIHHIIFDGLSRGIFMEDVSKAYTGAEISREAFDYLEYALKEEKDKDGEKYKASEKYYKEMFSGFESVSTVPADLPGREEDGKIGVANAIVEKNAVNEFCRKNGVTPSTLFLSAVLYTVSRFTNEKSVYISTISGGRSNPKIRKTVGMFVRTLPIHMSFDKKRSVKQLLSDSADVMFSAIDNEQYPFTAIASEYGYSTDIMYECQLGVGSGQQASAGEFRYTNQTVKLAALKFKITVAVEDCDGEISVSIRYNDAVYSKEYMTTFAESVKACAMNLMKDTEAEVSKLSLLSDGEDKLVSSFEKGACADIPVKLLHKAFESAAEQNPDTAALIACDRTLTYRELDLAANTAANNLIARGVTAGDKIAVLLPRKSSFLISVFAVLKAGGAFIPCDPEYPPARINHIITDSDARFIITAKEHMSDYPAEKTVDAEELLQGGNASAPDTEVTPDSLAYMIYTSGSTGNPKGVKLRHSGICNYLYPHSENVLFSRVREHTRVFVSVTTVSFDMSLKETMGSLCNGKTLVFANEEQMNDPRALARLMDETHADTINATPSRLESYFDYGPFRDALSRCRLILSGGEMYPIGLRNKLKKVTSATIINTYGPTEITVSSNMADITDSGYISVGKPVPNCVEYIVDSDENRLPHGVIGELYIGGAGVAEGYQNLDEMTAERFVNYNGTRIYKSGDCAKWDKEGNVIILGRKDNQVKLRGLRIELGEIEGLIDKQPHIKKSVVLIKKLNGVDNICAYYTADCDINPEELKKTLSASLTHYMVPAAYMQLDTIPVTPNGKTNTKALPEPVALEAGEYIPPADETEEYFCRLFEKVLKLDRVGALDNFFEIGGTSLLVTSVIVDASENGFEITYGDIFKKTTPRELAEMFSKEDTDDVTRIADFDKYNYDKINSFLSHNNMDSLEKGSTGSIGNILLTGATGYMGAHILAHFLKNEEGAAYCMLRKGRFSSARKRLENIMFYYFGGSLEKEIAERVQVFDGDVTSYNSFIPFEELPVDTVFNCAAMVKHFSSGTEIEDVNVGGAENCVKLCKKTGAALIHFSTTSVSGASLDGKPPVNTVLNEQSLYFGQRLDTKYTNSKLLSERKVLEAAAEGSIDGKVIRVGTLAPRESDGEFQINFLTNSFIGRLRSYMLLGCFPYSLINLPVCLGPIDKSAEAFFALAKTPRKCCLFNAVNNHIIPLGDIIIEMNKAGIKIDFTDDATFNKALREAEQDPKKAAILSSMLAYKNLAHGKKLVPIGVSSDYTTQALAKMGFFWEPVSEKYIYDFVNALAGLGFFDKSNLTR